MLRNQVIKFRLIFVMAGLPFLVGLHTCAAEEIYKITAPDGSVSFSTKKPSPNAKPAKLPKITKGEFKLNTSLKKSCSSHGGIDCTKGSDSDGSVICTDGFKEAAARYKFSCSEAKLAITDILEPLKSGEFKVFIRNLKSVAAREPKITLKLRSGEEVLLKGPDLVEPFGIAEFGITLTGKDFISYKPQEADIIIGCQNCG